MRLLRESRAHRCKLARRGDCHAVAARRKTYRFKQDRLLTITRAQEELIYVENEKSVQATAPTKLLKPDARATAGWAVNGRSGKRSLRDIETVWCVFWWIPYRLVQRLRINRLDELPSRGGAGGGLLARRGARARVPVANGLHPVRNYQRRRPAELARAATDREPDPQTVAMKLAWPWSGRSLGSHQLKFGKSTGRVQ